MKTRILLCFLSALVLAVSCDKEPDTPQGGQQTGPKGLKADLFDVVFSSSRIARDKTGTLDVVSNLGTYVSVGYNDDYGIYTSTFSGTPVKTVGSGYYRMHYSDKSAFKRALKDGFSIEMLFRPGELPSSGYQGLLSSLYDGGFGLRLNGPAAQFTVCCDEELTLKTSALESGKFYHVVCVWDFVHGKAELYMDGALIKDGTTSGNLRFPADEAAHWLCIGANCNTNINYARHTFNGEIAVVRIYDAPLTAGNVTSLYAKVMRPQTSSTLSVSEVAFRSPCNIAHGYRYYIYGKGFKAGDKVLFKSVVNDTEVECETAVEADRLSLILPSGLVTDSYVVSLKRGTQTRVLGTSSFTVSDDPDVEVTTGVLAHRCYHSNTAAGPYENSLNALIKTQKAGLYGAEFDCWSTSDGVVVVWHDKTINNKVIENTAWADLKKIKLPDGSPLATLEQFLVQGLKYPDVHLAFEIKRHSSKANNDRCIKEVVRLLREYKPERKQITVTSFDLDILKTLRALMPLSELNLALHGDISPQELWKNGIDGMAYNMNVVSAHPEWIDYARSKNMTVTVWLPSTIEDMATFIGLKVDAMTTNNVDLTRKMVERVYLCKDN